MKSISVQNRPIKILAGMIVDAVVCNKIASKWEKPGLFGTNINNQIGNWCVDHFRKYGTCPRETIDSYFEDWSSNKNLDYDRIRKLEATFLQVQKLYKDFPFATEYILDLADKYFNEYRLRQVIENTVDYLDNREIEEAHKLLERNHKINFNQASNVINLVEDEEAWKNAFDLENDVSMITYPGVLDEFLGRAMVKDSLISFMAPDKSGKTTWLVDSAVRALRNKRKVAYFEVGDMGERGVIRRFGQRITGLPMRKGRYKYPLFLSKEGIPRQEIRDFNEVLTYSRALERLRKLTNEKNLLKLSCHPNSSINVAQIDSIIRDWDDWIPDVVVIDYADILAPPTGYRESLDQIDETWKQLRRLSQELHCLVVTATQASAAAYNDSKGTLKKRHFSGRKTKLAHVNGMIGLNATSEERKNGITRVNWIVRRDDFHDEIFYEYAAGCLAIARPVIKAVEA